MSRDELLISLNGPVDLEQLQAIASRFPDSRVMFGWELPRPRRRFEWTPWNAGFAWGFGCMFVGAGLAQIVRTVLS